MAMPVIHPVYVFQPLLELSVPPDMVGSNSFELGTNPFRKFMVRVEYPAALKHDPEKRAYDLMVH
jgi:hypothetical protein